MEFVIIAEYTDIKSETFGKRTKKCKKEGGKEEKVILFHFVGGKSKGKGNDWGNGGGKQGGKSAYGMWPQSESCEQGKQNWSSSLTKTENSPSPPPGLMKVQVAKRFKAFEEKDEKKNKGVMI